MIGSDLQEQKVCYKGYSRPRDIQDKKGGKMFFTQSIGGVAIRFPNQRKYHRSLA